MTTYQILYWRDIPAQVKVRAGRERLSRMLSDRFQEAIDEAAMRAKTTSTDDYLDEWHSSESQERVGEATAVADAVAAELEAAYTAERLEELVRNRGRE
jgi:predicted ATPase with chaperone activity